MGRIVAVRFLKNLSSNGILLSGSGEFNLQTDSSNFIRQSGGTFSLQSQNLANKW